MANVQPPGPDLRDQSVVQIGAMDVIGETTLSGLYSRWSFAKNVP